MSFSAPPTIRALSLGNDSHSRATISNIMARTVVIASEFILRLPHRMEKSYGNIPFYRYICLFVWHCCSVKCRRWCETMNKSKYFWEPNDNSPNFRDKCNIFLRLIYLLFYRDNRGEWSYHFYNHSSLRFALVKSIFSYQFAIILFCCLVNFTDRSIRSQIVL